MQKNTNKTKNKKAKNKQKSKNQKKAKTNKRTPQKPLKHKTPPQNPTYLQGEYGGQAARLLRSTPPVHLWVIFSSQPLGLYNLWVIIGSQPVTGILQTSLLSGG